MNANRQDYETALNQALVALADLDKEAVLAAYVANQTELATLPVELLIKVERACALGRRTAIAQTCRRFGISDAGGYLAGRARIAGCGGAWPVEALPT